MQNKGMTRRDQGRDEGTVGEKQLQKMGRIIYSTSIAGLDKAGLDVSSLSSFADKCSDKLGNTFTGPTAFVVGCLLLGGLWTSFIVLSVAVWLFWPLLIVGTVITACNLGVAKCFASVADVKTRAYPRLIAALIAQVVLSVPLYLLGPMLVVVAALTGLMVSTCVFAALMIALLSGVAMAAQQAYQMHLASMESPSGTNGMAASSSSSAHTFTPPYYTLGAGPTSSSGTSEASIEAPHDQASAVSSHDEAGEQDLPTPMAQTLTHALTGGPISLFAAYPILIVVLCGAPVLSSILFLLLLTSPYWMIWWYLTTPMLLTVAIGAEVGLVFLYWSRVLSVAVYQRVCATAKSTYKFVTTNLRYLFEKVKSLGKRAYDEYRTRQEKRRKQFKIHSHEPPMAHRAPRGYSPAPRDEEPNQGSSVTTSRRNSHSQPSSEGQQGHASPSPAEHGGVDSEEKSAFKSPSNKDKEAAAKKPKNKPLRH